MPVVFLPCERISFNFSNFSLESVTIAPPSPEVRTLFPAKLKIPNSPNVPTFCLLTLEPIDSAASSIKLILFSYEIFLISLILHGNPA